MECGYATSRNGSCMHCKRRIVIRGLQVGVQVEVECLGLVTKWSHPLCARIEGAAKDLVGFDGLDSADQQSLRSLAQDSHERPGSKLIGKRKRHSSQPQPEHSHSRPNCLDVFFNSRTAGPHRHLSNFYGGVEFEYQALKFTEHGEGAAVRSWLRGLQSLMGADFESMLMRLQPEKRDWTAAQRQYWYDGAVPIHGILAKLVGGAVKGTAGMDKRLSIVVELATGKKLAPREVAAWRTKFVHGVACDAEADQRMRACLRAKYGEHGAFRDLLLSTGERPLHEKPMRGKGDRWTLHAEGATGVRTGGDMLGRLLVELRRELRAEAVSAEAAGESSGGGCGAGLSEPILAQ